MIRIAKLTDYATLLMVHLARVPGRSFSAAQLAEALGLPPPTVAKLLKRLLRADLLASTRGVGGGYRLARAPQAISVADVVGAIEGPLALTDCARGRGHCTLERGCATRGNWLLISRAVRVALEAISLADMARPQAAPIPLQSLQG
jgi:FeS assembly SUF system regulator